MEYGSKKCRETGWVSEIFWVSGIFWVSECGRVLVCMLHVSVCLCSCYTGACVHGALFLNVHVRVHVAFVSSGDL